jgi:hypothetical protein
MRYSTASVSTIRRLTLEESIIACTIASRRGSLLPRCASVVARLLGDVPTATPSLSAKSIAFAIRAGVLACGPLDDEGR